MGLARFSETANVATPAELTGSGTIVGTAPYMSPEQARGTKLTDSRSGNYCLGITLSDLRTGQPSYTGYSLLARTMAHANQLIPPLRDLRPEVPSRIKSIFSKMVAK